MNRDSYVVAKALALAVAVTEMLPPDRQETDADDMKAALARVDMTAAERFVIVEGARQRLAGGR